MPVFHTLHTDSREHTFVHHGEDLTPTQSIKLMELVGQFADVLSFMPEMMHMVYHEIKMKPNGSIQLYNDFQKLNHGTSTATLSPVWMKWWSCLRHGLFPPSTSLLAAHISSGSKKTKPATLQQLMDIDLHPHHQFTATYLYSVNIHSTNWSDHIHHLREVLGELG